MLVQEMLGGITRAGIQGAHRIIFLVLDWLKSNPISAKMYRLFHTGLQQRPLLTNLH